MQPTRLFDFIEFQRQQRPLENAINTKYNGTWEGLSSQAFYDQGQLISSALHQMGIKKGDKIALGSPIFTPYIEIPRLNDYEFIELEIAQDENNYWQYPDKELERSPPFEYLGSGLLQNYL